MGNQLSTPEDLEPYHRVKRFIEISKEINDPIDSKDDDHFSIITKKHQWFLLVIVAITAFSN